MFQSLKIYNQLFIRLLAIVLGVGASFYLLQKGLIYTSIFTFFIIILLFIELYFYIKNAFLLYDKTIEAILQNDFSADFSRHKSFKNYESLFKLFNNLKQKQNDQISKDIIYQSILNNIETGILILKKEENDWSIFLMNDYFSKHFTVPKVSKWSYLRNQLPSLCGIIEEQNFEEIKTSLQIRVNNQDTQTFVMQSSRSKTLNQEYYIVLLDSIQKVVEKKEKEAWINLMKVISHELLNSLTPIRSLSQNLHELVQQETLSQEDLEDMKQSVATMLNRSDHLQQFVESYRKLAMLPSPKKEKVELSQLIAESLQIMAPLFKQEKIQISNKISFKRWLEIDKKQIEQVLINLLTNSIYALSERKEKQITITAEVKEKRVFITITDTGIGIDTEIKDKIFLPFFTTRKEGAGIGLTLSKSIVEAHGGYLAFQNEDNKTSFVICLVE
ncbi:two-component sensor histidine kinase [Flavobacterium aquatile LMG 4008 = ATCC 11947]|uniref:histidine kinase n=2 Tax=Flavobacterium aquatile TaxID=245 RepID=A0A095TY38_9FLAO|nr:ATP-binding protein [Flavobacterium aquatile]KGD67278.1 histidine kinase [Flavobacterium aquatile LMG 4008 = ATCC 11947]OXA66791.1 two-component sensor histidine kinase [Flavobacterium aquatile LMG 4008 = ATCC 11947]